MFTPWNQQLAPEFNLIPVQLPGREKLFMHPPLTNVGDATTLVSSDPAIKQAVADSDTLIIFGHSFGAILAYEFAKTLQNFRSYTLVVSGSPAPDRPRAHRSAGLDDDDFVAQVKVLSGFEHPALEDPEMRELLLPALRADVRMHEEYMPQAPLVIRYPLVCIRGKSDALVDRQDALAWEGFTDSAFTYLEADGDHMYLADSIALLVDVFSTPKL
jgi:surfactin synthase thioesterase subunit